MVNKTLSDVDFQEEVSQVCLTTCGILHVQSLLLACSFNLRWMKICCFMCNLQGRSNFSECVRMIEQNITVHLNESGQWPTVCYSPLWWVCRDDVLKLCAVLVVCYNVFIPSEMELERLNGTVIEERDNITNSTREVRQCACTYLCRNIHVHSTLT